MMWFTTRLGVVIFIANIYCVASQSNKTGELCELASGKQGSCKSFTDCPVNLLDKILEPTINYCSEESVCCPSAELDDSITKSRFSQRISISYQKCKDYSDIRCKPTITPTIYGGDTVMSPEEFPHMALLTFGDEIAVCAGSLISDQYILTAAHCTSYGRENIPVDVAHLGFLDKNNKDQFNSLQKFNITEIHSHPNRKGLEKYDDIALLKLDRPVQLTSNVFPACLHEEYDIGASNLIATGWGLTEHGVPSDQLLKVKLKLKAYEICKISFEPYRKLINGIQDDSQICAGDINKDTCSGDSGGPLQIYRKDFICMQNIIGITSFGKNCGSESVAVYTRVSNYIPWIESIVWP